MNSPVICEDSTEGTTEGKISEKEKKAHIPKSEGMMDRREW